jgi:hypothetical protein
MTPTELSRYQETAWNNWIRRKLTSSELALCETRTDGSRRGQTHFKSVNDSEADVRPRVVGTYHPPTVPWSGPGGGGSGPVPVYGRSDRE